MKRKNVKKKKKKKERKKAVYKIYFTIVLIIPHRQNIIQPGLKYRGIKVYAVLSDTPCHDES